MGKRHIAKLQYVSTHSRLKAAGHVKDDRILQYYVSTHSRLKAAGLCPSNTGAEGGFQHTAA